ncbi:MAG TPA: hypothetical protein VN873_08785 [Candidatus Angelobacter sp.]|nr:hypothetical protein [Candidatus Angelobacter sp.]
MTEADSKFAQVEVLPAQFADKILSAPSIARVRIVYGVIFPLTIVAGFGLLAWAAILHQDSIDKEIPSEVGFSNVLCVLAACLFVILLAIRILIGTRNQWLRRVARNEINRRPTKIVNADGPGVRFVEIVPKSAWNDKTLTENATDVGFLDIQNGWLLFEGDNERYRIPAAAIVRCEQDYYTRLVPGAQSGDSERQVFYFFVVVTVNVSEQASVELPFRIRRSARFAFKKASDANYQLLQDINNLKRQSRPVAQI